MSRTASPPPQIPGLVFVQQLGSGGYADVHLYEQQSPRMPVAVKVLRREGLTDAIRRQFTDEANTMAQLADHPYIVQVFRAEVAEDGRPFLVMKYYPPPNLAARARTERFAVEDVLRTGIQIASAVETAHRASITHRDIKPANVLVSQYGAPGLTDFGIAGRGVRDEDEEVGVSVPWAPPEVLFGQSNGSAAGDVYSLSATLWHLLVGRSPFEVPGGDNSAYALLPRIRSTAPPSTGRADVPVSLERLLAQGMAKDPAHRPASALELARALQEVEQEQRFARTAFLVLDDRGHTTLVSQPRSADADEDDRTRVKAPQTVSAQARVAAPPRPVAPPYAGPVASPAPVATPGPGDAADEDTVRRTPSPVPAGAAAGTAAGIAAGTAGGAPGVPGQDPATPAAPDRSGGRWTERRTLVVALAAVAAVALLGAGLLAWRPGTGAAPTPGPTPRTVQPGGDQDAVDIPAQPAVSAVPTSGGVRFTWTYAAPGRRDVFRFRYAPSSEEAVRAPLRQTDQRQVTVRTQPKGTRLCVVVTVVRSGVPSEPSDPVCGRAG